MNIWFAGQTGTQQREDLTLELADKRLLSYFYIRQGVFGAKEVSFDTIVRERRKSHNWRKRHGRSR